jgi:hypothetical protein
MLVPIHRARPICRCCQRRPALACFRGSWRVIKHHDVCRQCWRSFMDAREAANVAAWERASRRGPGAGRRREKYETDHFAFQIRPRNHEGVVGGRAQPVGRLRAMAVVCPAGETG